MNKQENIKKMYEQAKLDTIVEKDKVVLEKMKEIYLQESNAESKPAELFIWRIIMKSNITKIATAAVIIIAVILSINLFSKTGSVAYSVEQTIEAMRKVTTVHGFAKSFAGEKIEMWVEVNPETGANERFYIDGSGVKFVAIQDEAYTYQKEMNIVVHTKKGGFLISNTIRFGRFIEDMLKNSEPPYTEVKIEEIKGEKPHILLVVDTSDMTLECKVDTVTKLPMSMIAKPKNGQQVGMGLAQSIDEIYYNEPLPEGIFEFNIPEGAQVIEQ